MTTEAGTTTVFITYSQNKDFEEKARNHLEQIVQNENVSIRKKVAIEALEHDNIELFFNDLLRNGCQSGWVQGLVWYSQTHRFYDEHYYEIEELRKEYEYNFGIPIDIKHDLKNFFAWFAFEEIAYQIAQELKIEI